jgi:hypothetical protein
MTTSTFA